MNENIQNSRRKFLKIGSSMLLVSSATYKTEAKVRFKRKTPASHDLVEVGLILGRGGHSNGIWGRLFNPPEGDMRRLGMIYTKVWSATRENAEEFSKKFGVEIVDSFDDMVDKVDGVFVDDFNAVSYNHKLAQPYLEAGIPTFVNRPFTDSIQKSNDMINLSKKHNAPLMTGSSYEHLKEIYTIKATVKKDEITGYEAWNACSDYYTHGLHGIWWIYAAIGGGIEAVSLKCDDWLKSCGSVTHVIYKDRGKGIGPLVGRINEGQMPDEKPIWCAIVIQPGNQKHLYNSIESWANDEFMWLPMLHRIQWMFETGEMYQTHDEIAEKCALFTGAFYSHFEKDGDLVGIDNLPEDWAIGLPSSWEGVDVYAKLFGKEKGKLDQ